MECPGYELFACTAFSGDQDGRFESSHLSDHFQHVTHRLRSSDDALEWMATSYRFLEHPHLLGESLPFQSAPDGQDQLLRLKRFGQVVVCTSFDRLHGAFNRAVGRHDQYLCLGRYRIDLFQDLDPIHSR